MCEYGTTTCIVLLAPDNTCMFCLLISQHFSDPDKTESDMESDSVNDPVNIERDMYTQGTIFNYNPSCIGYSSQFVCVCVCICMCVCGKPVSVNTDLNILMAEFRK